jgi:hypothetical protein
VLIFTTHHQFFLPFYLLPSPLQFCGDKTKLRKQRRKYQKEGKEKEKKDCKTCVCIGTFRSKEGKDLYFRAPSKCVFRTDFPRNDLFMSSQVQDTVLIHA